MSGDYSMKNLEITTAQIAKICDVSQGTVDRALNNRPDINAETKQKILDVAKQYGYRETVRTGGNKLSGQVGIIVFNLQNEYFAELITELEYALREENLGTIVMMSHYDPQYEIECIRNLYNMGVKGIVLCSVNNGSTFENYLKLFDIPIVTVGNKITSLPYVGINDSAAMQEMTEKVLKETPENILYFSPALRYTNAHAQRARYEGFLRAIGNKNFTVVTDIAEIKSSYETQTTVICSTDYYALQVYYKTRGVKIVGFDNIKALDKYKIAIDSVDYSMCQIANSAVDIIKHNKRKDVIIPHTIIKR